MARVSTVPRLCAAADSEETWDAVRLLGGGRRRSRAQPPSALEDLLGPADGHTASAPLDCAAGHSWGVGTRCPKKQVLRELQPGAGDEAPCDSRV